MNLIELIDMWDNDSVIDDTRIERESLSTPKLHSKYLRILLQRKGHAVNLYAERDELRKAKFRYYRGEMSKDELAEKGWVQWQGVKPIKSEMDEFLKGDADLVALNKKIEQNNLYIEAVESIMKQISGRDWGIRNHIEHKKFMAGN